MSDASTSLGRRTAVAGSRGAALSDGAARSLGFLPILFVVSLIVPLSFNIGPLNLSTYRLALLVMFLPALYTWIWGSTGRFRTVDACVIVFTLWLGLANIYHFGLGPSVEPLGIQTLEHLGAYMVGRAYIRAPEDFRKISRIAIATCLVLLPFGLYEALTGTNLYLDLWSRLGKVPADVYKEARLGLDRVQGPFDHPILFGVYATPLLGLACFVAFRGMGWRIGLTAAVFLTGFLSVSSGPISALAVAMGMIFWHMFMHRIQGHWWILLGLATLAYIAVDLLSNRTPIVVAISYLALNVQTGIGRVWIFQWGWVNIFAHPFFGVGEGSDWERHRYMTISFDMFWMYYAVFYGFIAGFTQMAAPVTLSIALMRRKMSTERMRSYRLGWLIGFVGIFMAGWMVHLWKVPLAYYFFFLGAGVWMLDHDDTAGGDPVTDTASDAPRRSRYTRFLDEPTGAGRPGHPRPSGAHASTAPSSTTPSSTAPSSTTTSPARAAAPATGPSSTGRPGSARAPHPHRRAPAAATLRNRT